MTRPTITKELVVQLAREAGFSMENSAAMQAAENLVNASYKLGRNAGLEALEQTQGKAVAYAAFADNGNIRIWTSVPEDVKRLADRVGFALTPLYTHPQASEPVGINGLTEAETSASMSVRGLSAPIVGLQSVHDAITSDPSLCDLEPKRPPNCGTTLRSALNAMLTQFGMDEDEWNKPTFDQARAALLQSTPDARPVGELTDEQIEQAVKTYGVSWTGYREDKHGFYTIPILSPYHYQFARAILAAARTQPERDRQ